MILMFRYRASWSRSSINWPRRAAVGRRRATTDARRRLCSNSSSRSCSSRRRSRRRRPAARRPTRTVRASLDPTVAPVRFSCTLTHLHTLFSYSARAPRTRRRLPLGCFANSALNRKHDSDRDDEPVADTGARIVSNPYPGECFAFAGQ